MASSGNPKPSGTNYRESAQFQSAVAMADEMQREDKMRNELFAGKYESAPAPQEEMTVDQLVKKAENTHTETTQAAQRALRVLEQTKQVQADTMAELDTQKKQVNRLNDKLTKVNEELSYSERLLLYMRRCCCCWVFDSCTGADPEARRKREWERQVERGETRSAVEMAGKDAGARRSTKSAGGSSSGQTSAAGNGFRDPDIKLTPEHQATETKMHAETRKQNEILDQIHNGLGNLLENAKNIRNELDDANKEAERLHDRVEATKGRIENVNTKSQLRKFR